LQARRRSLEDRNMIGEMTTLGPPRSIADECPRTLQARRRRRRNWLSCSGGRGSLQREQSALQLLQLSFAGIEPLSEHGQRR